MSRELIELVYLTEDGSVVSGRDATGHCHQEHGHVEHGRDTQGDLGYC